MGEKYKMYSYLIGKVISTHFKSICVECNYTGYLINVGRPDNFEKGKVGRIWVYKHCSLSNKNTIIEEMYGFKTWEEKEFFLNCMTISGVGPKTAMNFMKNDVAVLKQLISNKDQAALEQLPGISKKHAYLLVEYLSQTFIKDKAENFDNIADVINVLKTLGYSQDDINYAINKLCETHAVENTMETSDIVSMAIKLISVKNEVAVPKA